MKNIIRPPFLCLMLALQSICGHAQLFTKITTGPVVTTPSGSRSCNFLDFDNDGFQDLFISNGKAGGEDNLLYHNAGNGMFTLVNDTVCHDGNPSDGATCADYDNDGWIDLYVANWYGIDNLHYRNIGGDFEKLDTGIVAHDGGYSETAAWGDMDADGMVDLYVANSDGDFHNFLYRNIGNGGFQKIIGILPVSDAFRSRCVNWIDYDLDGDQDLFVANESNQRNQLYRNDGFPNFTKITTGSLATSQFSSHSSSWEDYDNDGDFDVFIANYDQVNQLFQNDGVGAFTLVPNAFGTDVGCSFSSSFADYDNDGDLDLFVTNGYCTSYTQNYLYENDGHGAWIRNFAEPMATDSGSSYGCAWGDYDNDGFMDLAVANWRNETQPNALYHNEGNGNHWLEIRLEGTVSNRSGIGAIVRCQATIQGNVVNQMREVTAQSGYCSQNSLVVHFGLGDATQIDQVQVNWPSGLEQIFGNIETNTMYFLGESGSLLAADKLTTNHFSFEILPNPNDGHFTLEFQSAPEKWFQIDVLDMLGRTIWTENLRAEPGMMRLPLQLDAPWGLYMIRVSSPDGTLAERKMLVGH